MVQPKGVKHAKATRGGMAAAKARGVKIGRPRIAVSVQRKIARDLRNGHSITATAQRQKVAPGTVRRIKAELEAAAQLNR